MKVSKEVVEGRPDEIIDAAVRLYREKTLKEITLREISELTSISRPSIYNYFQTKEEIFLAMLDREYRAWNESLASIYEGGMLTLRGFAEAIASSLEKRELLLKLLCMNLYEIEEHSRVECIVAFKRTYQRSIDLVSGCLGRFFPSITEERRERFIYELYPFMYGLYPYVHPTEKQREAMDEAGIVPPSLTVRAASEMFIIDILSGGTE